MPSLGLEQVLEMPGANRAVIVLIVIVTLVGLLAALGPSRRGPATQAIEAWREE